jgi:hypothetical protein
MSRRRPSSASRAPRGFRALTWDPETGAIRGAEGPRGFASYREAVEVSRFLRLDLCNQEDCIAS